MTRVFSKRSKDNLLGVHPDLVKVTTLALELSEADFTVIEGLRSLETQKKNFASGASKTIDGSRHLAGPDGYGHAIDIISTNKYDPFNWEEIFKIADGFRKAAIQLGIPIRWGGAWHFDLSEEPSRSAKQLNEAYHRTQKETGKKPFIDGVHFELPKSSKYPQ